MLLIKLALALYSVVASDSSDIEICGKSIRTI